MEQPDEKILDRIKKLHAKAVSAKEIGSDHEALTFMSAVQKMLDKYDMDMSEVEYQLSLTQDPVNLDFVDPESFGQKEKKTRDAMQNLVAAAICRLFHCQFLPDTRSRRGFWIVGRREHREIANFMCVTILRLMEELSYKAYVAYFYECRNRGDVTQARGYKEAWRQGFATKIGRRVEEVIEVKTVGVGLVRMNTEQQKIEEFLDKIEKAGGMSLTKAARARLVGNTEGLLDGLEAGESVSLSGVAVSAPKRKTLRLGAGND